MKAETKDNLDLAPLEERAILDQIRNDRDLIARLNITSQELDALSKCALLGTLTCKQDMLFILRQIREATSLIDHTTLFPQPPAVKEETENYPVPDLRQIAIRVAPTIIPQPDMRDTVARRRIPATVGVLFLVVAVVAGLAWNGLLVMPRWRDNFMNAIATLVSSAPSSGVWYDKLDHLNANVLLFWEFMLVVSVTIVIFLKSRRDSRRFKVRPGQRLR